MGAQKSAQTFLSEVSRAAMPCPAPAPRCPSGPVGVGGVPDAPVRSSVSPQIRWEKNITLGEPPGFLHSWWW